MSSQTPLPSRILQGVSNVGNHYAIRNFRSGLGKMVESKATMAYGLFIVFVLILGLIGPTVAPHDANDRMRSESGELLRGAPPSLDHPLGTTETGYDVFSRLLIGAQPTAVAGMLGGVLIITIGATIGITAGYVGGRTENILMRFTDLVYGVPLIPTAIVLIAFFGVGFLQSILVIAMVLWRGSARVLRSQVLQIKEREFILAAKATGTSTPRIILKHIFPNVATMAIMFFAIGIGYTIIIQAGLSFLGVVNPFTPSWGVMMRNAYTSGQVGNYWWWSIPPGLMIALTVVATFMFGRGYERVSGGGDDEEAMAQAG